MNRGRDVILDQLAYLVDELTLQRPLLARLPEERLTLTHVGSNESIRDRYARMLRVEREEHLPRVIDSVTLPPAPDTNSQVDELIAAIIAHREVLVEAISSINPWDDSLTEFLHGLAVKDGATLREIAEQFYEMRT